MKTAHLTGYLYLVAATFFWAGNYVLGKYAVTALPPVSLVYLRWLLAAPLLILIARVVEQPDWKAVAASWRLLAVLSVLGMAGYTLLLYSALLFTSPLNASLINSVNPALIILASAVFLGTPLGWSKIAGVGVGFGGVLLVLTKGRIEALADLSFNTGDLIMLAAIACWTAYTILGKRMVGVKPITATAAQAAIIVVLMTPVVLATGLRLPRTPQAAASLLYIVVFPSVLSYVLWNLAMSAVDPGKAGVYLNLITVFTAFATVLLGMPLTFTQVGGGLLILGGVMLSGMKEKT
jgi:drug/metabolite transporter (DMT)-like permease